MGMFFRKQKPAGNDNQRRASKPTVIGEETAIEGTLDTGGEVHIEGQVRGVIKADICVIGASGFVEGEVIADEIIVRGRVAGPMQARHVHLQPAASVEGDITCETIAIDNGARLSGAVWQQEAGAAANLPFSPAANLFADPSWGDKHIDDERPLRAVRPRN